MLMLVPVMHVGIVLVRVRKALMRVSVHMRLASVPFLVVAMLVMRIMDVLVRVRLWSVSVTMLMVLGEMQPNSGRHQHACRNELPGDNLVVQDNRQRGAEERRN